MKIPRKLKKKCKSLIIKYQYMVEQRNDMNPAKIRIESFIKSKRTFVADISKA